MARTSRRTAACALLALALAGCGGGGSDVATPTTTPAVTTAPPEPTSSPGAEPTSTASQGEDQALAVYYVSDTTNGPRLYREFHSVPVGDEPVRDAVEAMLTVEADDPDYTSLWPAGTEVLGVDVAGDTATVDLSEEAASGSGGSAFESASVQQLVHTVTAADTSVQQVLLLVEGEQRETLWGAVDVSGPLTRAPQAEVLGPVWLLTPAEGGTLAVGEEFGGVATVFEATVSWRWLRGGEVVAEGFSTATEGGPGRGDWTAEVDVPAGDYVLEAYESSAQDGSRTFTDSKTVTVTG